MLSFFKKKTPADSAVPAGPELPAAAPVRSWREKLGFGAPPPAASEPAPAGLVAAPPVPEALEPAPEAQEAAPQARDAAPEEAGAPPAERAGWLARLKTGLRKTGASIAQVFTGTQIDDTLYEEL